MPTLRIGEVAKASGVAASAIRFYESVGLLPRAGRSQSRYRLYPEGMVDRIEFIKKAQHLGLRLPEIREILELSDRGHCPCGHVEQLLKGRLAELRQRIADLKGLEGRIALALRRRPNREVRPQGKALCPTIARQPIKGKDKRKWKPSA